MKIHIASGDVAHVLAPASVGQDVGGVDVFITIQRTSLRHQVTIWDIGAEIERIFVPGGGIICSTRAQGKIRSGGMA